ncbi:peptide ABC transporter substrate-binding protein [Aphanothece hegewaldii CCALA 016]|uniref:Peptide ABC transporter substrate-binding protein n=1 Tax=Aphanothece hegewaldii CCALA 016 TaxID=2107694 RepID=A0A2T1M0R4_9CHRO|nr:ABC transporter substrate-binding protein [Aphanothece hegewaldii]PSF38242.1 peptide ABC transporter substrate-binding protein [Aphanothece hegewaldii CCALA 016]
MINKLTKKTISFCLSFLIIFFFLIPLTACAPTSTPNQLVTSIVGDPKTFNAVLSQESPNIFGLVYEGLITENPITGQKEPVLAEKWEVSEDKLSIIVTLKKDLKWSDGQPLTIDDVLFSYNELYLNPKIPNNYRDSFRIGRSQSFPTIKKLEDRSIEFRITEPFAPFLDTLSVPILPKHILKPTIEKKSSDGKLQFLSTWGVDTPPEKIIVNGAYKLKNYTTGQRIIFDKNPYYWKKDTQGNQLPHIAQVIWAIVESQDTALLQFRSKSLDYIGVTPEYFSLLKKEDERGNFTIFNGGPAYGTNFLSFNLNQGSRNGKPLIDPIKAKWFNNVKFRQAVAYGIDRTRMINNIYRGLGEKQNSFMSIQSPFYNQSLAGYDYNPEQAKALLQEAGFKYNSDNQLVDSDNHIVRFNLLTNAGNPIREAIGAQIKEDLSKIGIIVDFAPIAFSVLVDKLSNSLDWESYILGFTGDNEPHAPNIWYTDGNLHAFNQKPQPGIPPVDGRILYDWEKEIENLYIEGAKELNIEKRKVIYNEAQQLMSEYLPFIYLVNPLALSAVRNCFEEIQFSALGGAFWNLEELKNTCGNS